MLCLVTYFQIINVCICRNGIWFFLYFEGASNLTSMLPSVIRIFT
ncbi:hypothetical protein T03_11173 [Trichinella britovi]|uniref:Uncharacterized protein n=1 Tax=Trichinella britovi TaxID=45882 RepID=A0A0V0Z366_TRIBR|nr:hypothetical protein T03_11173 [Trichinella britovi]